MIELGDYTTVNCALKKSLAGEEGRPPNKTTVKQDHQQAGPAPDDPERCILFHHEVHAGVYLDIMEAYFVKEPTCAKRVMIDMTPGPGTLMKTALKAGHKVLCVYKNAEHQRYLYDMAFELVSQECLDPQSVCFAAHLLRKRKRGNAEEEDGPEVSCEGLQEPAQKKLRPADIGTLLLDEEM